MHALTCTGDHKVDIDTKCQLSIYMDAGVNAFDCPSTALAADYLQGSLSLTFMQHSRSKQFLLQEGRQ